MTIQNPYNEIPHKVFKRTFLQEISASVTFADKSVFDHKNEVFGFLKENFGLNEVMPSPFDFGTLAISSDNKYEKYLFTTHSASVTLDARMYRSYNDSLAPKLNRLVAFLSALGVERIREFSISKKNLFSGQSSNAYAAWKLALKETFKDEKLVGIVSEASSIENPFKLTIEGNRKFDGGEIKVPFLIEVVDKANFHFTMDLVGIVKDVDVYGILENANVLNDIIFGVFCDIVSDKIINFCSNDK
jgi:hypothetical protein